MSWAADYWIDEAEAEQTGVPRQSVGGHCLTFSETTLGGKGSGMTQRNPTNEVIERAAKRFGLTIEDVLSKNRHKTYSLARHLAAWLLKQEGWSYPEIGRILGRDHTTIMSSVRRVDAERAKSEALARELDGMKGTVAA